MDRLTTPRARQVWGHLVALFGADAVERKYGLEPPDEWSGALETLSEAQLRAGVSGLLNGGRAYVPTLPEFLAVCRNGREFSRELPKLSYRDDWEPQGNQHLLAYVLLRPKRYSPDGVPSDVTRARTLCLCRAKARWVKLMRESGDEKGLVDVETQKAIWADEMAQAEREIDALVKKEAA
jgi:hypothetical protein